MQCPQSYRLAARRENADHPQRSPSGQPSSVDDEGKAFVAALASKNQHMTKDGVA